VRLHILAVGQADAIVVELPSGRLAVIDFGHEFLLEYLAALDPMRMRRFAFCLLTHAHHDHYACLKQFIFRHDAQVDEYWYSFTETSNVPALLAMKAAAAERKRGRLLVQDLPAAQPYFLEPQVEITRFAPTTWDVERAPGAGGATAENNRGVVLLLRYGQASILLGADAEAERWIKVEGQARAAHVSLAADVIKPPHHGALPPRGLPERLWPLLLRSSNTFVAFSVGRKRDKPALDTVASVRGRAHIRCTGRALTCRKLPSITSPAPYLPANDLIAQILAPAPEARPVQSCFGTQIYDLDLSGTVTLVTAQQPAFLDACVVPSNEEGLASS